MEIYGLKSAWSSIRVAHDIEMVVLEMEGTLMLKYS